MKRIPDNGGLPQIIRLDRKVANGYILATYKVSDEQFVTYRNNKAIGWASTKILALDLHEMYYQVYKQRYP